MSQLECDESHRPSAKWLFGKWTSDLFRQMAEFGSFAHSAKNAIRCNEHMAVRNLINCRLDRMSFE